MSPERKEIVMRKTILGIVAGLVVGAVMLAPASAHVTSSVKHDWKHFRKLAKKMFYTKKQIDAKLAGSGSVSVDRHAFLGRNDPDVLTRGPNGSCPNGFASPLSAPVAIPDGVEVTSFTAYWYDANAAEAMVIELLAVRHPDDAEATIGSIGTIGSPGDGVNTQTLATPHVVDNDQFAYEVKVTGNTNHCVRSAVIGYST